MGAALSGLSSVASQFWSDVTSGNVASDLWYNGLFGEESPSQVSALQGQCQSEIVQAGGTPADVGQCVSDINGSLSQSGALPTSPSITEVIVVGALLLIGLLFLTRR